MTPKEGLCGCGCGERPALAKRTDALKGWVKGQPKHYVFGHQGRQTAREAFDRYVPIRGDGCWLWAGYVNERTGYACVGVHGKTVAAHRMAYELLVGPIPDDLTIDHVYAWGCRHRHCVNPAHLEPVTRGENVLRGTSPTALNAQKTHCKRGHEFTPENTLAWGKSGRACLACRKAAEPGKVRRRRERRIAARAERDHA